MSKPSWIGVAVIIVVAYGCVPEPTDATSDVPTATGPDAGAPPAQPMGGTGGAAGGPLAGGGGASGFAGQGQAGAGAGGGAGAVLDAGEHDAANDPVGAPLPPLPLSCAPERWVESAVDVGEVTLNVACRAAGQARAPLVILLHGYPELHLAWNELAPPLLEHGFALLAPDQRGYNLSDKPEPVDAYKIEAIVQDLHGLIEASGRQRVLLVGHDWGGLVSFLYAHEHPERVRGLVILNGPHPDIWGHPEVDPVQGMASDGYVPLLVGPTGALAMPLLDSMLMPYLSAGELEQYRAAWNQQDAFTSMNKWYEANVYPEVTMPTGITVDVPTLAIWGMADTFVTPSELDHLPDYVSNLEIVKLEGVDHWITHQQTERLIQEIVDFEARLPKE